MNTTYRCPLCQRTERLEFDTEAVISCSGRSCSGGMRKVNRAPGSAFKGSGFYSNE